MPGAAVRKEVSNFANTAMVIQVWGLIRFGVNGRQTGSYPQTGFGEIRTGAARLIPHILQADRWPGMISCHPVIRGQSPRPQESPHPGEGSLR